MTGRDVVMLVSGIITGVAIAYTCVAIAYTWQDFTFWWKQRKLRKNIKKGDK